MHHAREFVRVLGVDVVVAGEPADARRPGSRPRAASIDAALPLGPGRVAAVGRHEQDRDRDIRVALGRVVLPEPAQDRDVALVGQPRGDRAVGSDLEVREGAADAALGPVGVGRPDVALDLLEPAAGQPRRGERGPAGLPVGELVAQLEPAAVDADDPADRVRVAGGELERRRCRPTTGRPRPAGRGRALR